VNTEVILIGGLAANAHSAIRNTRDVDLVYRRSPGNISRLVTALAPLRPYLRGAPPGLPFVGASYRCVDLQTLIHLKRAAGRPKDFEAIAELEVLLEEQSK
jgi:hypothetical protein